MSALRLRGIWKRAMPVEGGDTVLQATWFSPGHDLHFERGRQAERDWVFLATDSYS